MKHLSDIRVSLLRVRLIKQPASGERCFACDCVVFLNQFKAIALIKIGNLPLDEQEIDGVLCHSCAEKLKC